MPEHGAEHLPVEYEMWDENPYYNPEKCGLEIVADIEWDDEAWQFNQTVIWRELETGELRMADDMGCSCPVPFEDYGPERLPEKVTRDDAIAHLKQKAAEGSSYGLSKEQREMRATAAIAKLVA